MHRKSRRRRRQPAGDSADTAPINPAALSYLFTSLSILLLAIFVFLDTLAVPDGVKREKALRSLQQEFPAIRARLNHPPRGTEKTFVLDLQRHLPRMSFSEHSARLVSILREGGLRVRESDSELSIHLEGNAVFTPVHLQLRAQLLPLLRRLAAELGTRSLDLDIEVRLPAEDFPKPEAWQRAALAAATLERFFLDAGLAASALRSAGQALPAGTPEQRAPSIKQGSGEVSLTIRGHAP